MTARELVTLTRQDGRWSWSQILNWVVLVASVIVILIESPLLDPYDQYLTPLLAALNILIRVGRTDQPLRKPT